jgi:hypothetical protein
MRVYGKSNPEKPIFKVPSKSVEENAEQTVVLPVSDAGDNYRKPEGLLSPKSFFVIVSGGEQTERKYFKIISNQDRFKRIKIEFVADPKQLSPKGLLDTAKYKQNHYQSSQEDEPDRIFIVSDVDHFMSELLEIKPECEQLNIPLIISNSCFEVWLYYAFYQHVPDFKIPEKKEKISQTIRHWMPNNINPVRAIFNIYKNIENAKSHYREDINGIPELFSTNMFHLAESLLPFIETELDLLIEEDRQRINKHKNTKD